MKRKRTIDRKRDYKTVKYEFCECVEPFIERFEDFTYKILGQEITRNIEVEFCPLCYEKWIDGASVTEMEKEIKAKVIALANERVEAPKDYVSIKYFDDEDVLVIHYEKHSRFHDKDSKVITHSKSDIQNGIIHTFDIDDKLLSIEILDFYGKFT